ncbi:hypothetical protein BDR04DRAFT_1152591 [Suillus decipiens]|nr:hypothetical protein BDR04DRAFT_1152591 [Suillus decipiens]
MNRATRIELGLEPNPHPEPGISPTIYLRLGKIYSNEEHFRSQMGIVESQLDRLGSLLTNHAIEMHPHGDPHYQVDVRPYYGTRRQGAHLFRWRCPTCHYIFKAAQRLNHELDDLEQELQEIQQEGASAELPTLPFNKIMTDPLRYPFPHTADESANQP